MNPSRWRCARLPVILLVVLTGLATAAFGQAAGPSHSPSDIERIEQLERAVKELQAEIAALKSASPTDARIAELERKIEVLAGEIEAMRIGEAAEAKGSDYGLGPAASKIYRTERGLSIGGYGEMLYSHFGSPQPARADLERAVLYVGYKFNDRWLLNMEVEHEHAGEEVDVEFAYLDYLWRPEANFRAGLLLVPMGFLNELHEPTVYLGARRPDVEQLIIPATWRA